MKPPKGIIYWTDRNGRDRSSLAHRIDIEREIDADGLSSWERAGWFYGAYQVPYEKALEYGRQKLIERGFDPENAEKLIPPY